MTSAIGQSTDYDNNYSNKTYTNKLIANTLTDRIATFSQGTVTDLVPPTEFQDAVTKGFVDGLANPSLPLNSVQYNNLVFAGSPNLTFVPDTLTVNGQINDGSGINITSGVISGLADPVLPDQIATKNYVDSFTSATTNTYIQSDTGVVYTPSQMLNGIILRNLTTYNVFGLSLTDTTPSAAQFIAAKPTASAGFMARFRLMNDNPESNQTTIEGRDRFVLTIAPGAGVTFYPNEPFDIRRAYMFDAYILFTNVVVPAVTIIINRCAYSGATLYQPPSVSSSVNLFNNIVDYINYNTAQLTGNLFWNLNDPTESTTNYAYTTDDIKNQMVVRNPSGNSNDTFSSIIDIKYMKQIMIIQNPSAFNVVLNGQTDIWNLTPNPITIPPGKQCTLRLGTTPMPSYLGSYYNLGNYNTTGGTGSGITVKVMALETSFTITNPGTGYAVDNYTTTNLTTPSATGLIVAVTGVDVLGDIVGITAILNYLPGGYQNGDIIQIDGGDNNATIQLGSVNQITSFTLNNLGNGAYVASDILSISGPGPGINALFTLGSFLDVMSIGMTDF